RRRAAGEGNPGPGRGVVGNYSLPSLRQGLPSPRLRGTASHGRAQSSRKVRRAWQRRILNRVCTEDEVPNGKPTHGVLHSELRVFRGECRRGVGLHRSVAYASGVIHACVDHNDGKLRVVSANTRCKPAELPISWSTSGARGKTGATGRRGA